MAYTPVFTVLISNSLSKIYLVDGLPGLLPMGQVRRESYLPKRNLYLSGRADRGFLNPGEWFSYIFERVIRQQIKKSILEMIQKGAVPENIHTLPQKRLIKVGEFFKTKTLQKKVYQALLEFPEGCRVLQKIPSVGTYIGINIFRNYKMQSIFTCSR